MKINTKVYCILITIITLALTYVAPWWTIPAVIFIVSYFYEENSLKATLISAGLTTLIWTIWAIIKDDMAMNTISKVTSEVLMNIGPYAIYFITGLVIGITSGLAALSGRMLRG